MYSYLLYLQYKIVRTKQLSQNINLQISEYITNNHQVDVIMIDFSKTFDSVNTIQF